MTPTIDEILDFSINSLYDLFENTTDEKGVKQETLFEIETKLIEKFFPEIKCNPKNLPEKLFPLKRLFLPVYWHFYAKYSLQNLVMENNNHQQAILYSKLRQPLPDKQEFKQQILDKDWVESYIQANLEQLYL